MQAAPSSQRLSASQGTAGLAGPGHLVQPAPDSPFSEHVVAGQAQCSELQVSLTE